MTQATADAAPRPSPLEDDVPAKRTRLHWISAIGRRRMLRRFRRNKAGLAAVAFIAFLALIALLAPLIQPYDANEQTLQDAFADPFSTGHVFGADHLGRDILSRLIAGSRIAIVAAAQAVGVALLLGAPPGLTAGYAGGWIDSVIMRVSDAIQSLPPLILAIAIVGALGPGLRNAMLALGVIFAPNFLRILRASVLEVREETFIEASRSIGTPTIQIVLRRILPNAMPPLLVQISLVTGFAFIAEASLSFIGLGVQPPQASWGSMLGQGYNFIGIQPWLVVFPGLAIAFTVLACNVLGDALRDSIGKETRRDQ